MSNSETSNTGIFITLEGGEGVGKSSQIERLRSRFEKLGRAVVVTREPGGTKGAEIMRHVLLSGAAEPFGPDLEAMLFSAARADHVELVIRPALMRGDVVLCDRFIDSTRVYQGITGNVPLEFLKQLEGVVCDDVMPDLTLLLDLDPETGMKRAGKRRDDTKAPDRFEKETIDKHKVRRDAFLEIAKSEPDRVVVVDASGTEARVAERIWKAVLRKFPQFKGKKA